MSVVTLGTLRELLYLSAARRPAALLTLVEARGSAPARVGARLVAGQGGALAGTVGGSEMERAAVEHALQMMPAGESGIFGYDLQYRKPDAPDVACGGSIRILVETYDGARRAWPLDLVEAWVSILENRRRALVVQVVGSTCGMPLGLWSVGPAADDVARIPVVGVTVKNGHAIFRHDAPHVHGGEHCREPLELFAEVVDPGPYVLLVGGGHVNRELAAILDRLEYSYAVFDDRAGFADEARFPRARERFEGRAEDFFQTDLRRFTHAIVCSWSQELDLKAARNLLEEGTAFVGVIGSASKGRDFRSRLQSAGVAEELVGRLQIPIGVPIGAHTVAEIALSIAGKIVESFRPRS